MQPRHSQQYLHEQTMTGLLLNARHVLFQMSNSDCTSLAKLWFNKQYKRKETVNQNLAQSTPFKHSLKSQKNIQVLVCQNEVIITWYWRFGEKEK